MQFNALYKKMGNWYVAWVEEVPGVNTQGKTLKEARENLREALELVLEANREISHKEFSGREEYIREPISVSR
jgi:predicted RNase H-like HicB family nuclease